VRCFSYSADGTISKVPVKKQQNLLNSYGGTLAVMGLLSSSDTTLVNAAMKTLNNLLKGGEEVGMDGRAAQPAHRTPATSHAARHQPVLHAELPHYTRHCPPRTLSLSLSLSLHFPNTWRTSPGWLISPLGTKLGGMARKVDAAQPSCPAFAHLAPLVPLRSTFAAQQVQATVLDAMNKGASRSAPPAPESNFPVPPARPSWKTQTGMQTRSLYAATAPWHVRSSGADAAPGSGGGGGHSGPDTASGVSADGAGGKEGGAGTGKRRSKASLQAPHQTHLLQDIERTLQTYIVQAKALPWYLGRSGGRRAAHACPVQAKGMGQCGLCPRPGIITHTTQVTTILAYRSPSRWRADDEGKKEELIDYICDVCSSPWG